MNSQQKYEEKEDNWAMPGINYIPCFDFPSRTAPLPNDYFAGANSNKGILHGYDAKPAHYNNENGSIYKFCDDQELNPWEFDIIKRIVRCRKKGQFKEDLEKTKMAIDLYLTEYNG